MMTAAAEGRGGEGRGGEGEGRGGEGREGRGGEGQGRRGGEGRGRAEWSVLVWCSVLRLTVLVCFVPVLLSRQCLSC